MYEPDYYIHPTTAVTDGEEVNMFPRLPPSPSQSLFETNNNNNSDTWFMRKHSVASDGQDFLTPPLTSWRRGSAPPDKLCSRCAACFAKQLPCGHAICSSCRLSSSQHCPVCVPSLDSKLMPSSHPNMTRSLLTPPPHYPCAKMSNIPWDVSQNDVRHFFGQARIPSLSVHAQSIHIMMDRTTGKTLSDAYIEFASMSDLRRAIETRNQKPLKGRIVTVTECSQEELLKVVFPKWRGQFCGISAIPPDTEVVKSMSTAAGGGNGSTCPPFITREEINSLLVVCKNYKLHFSRKCAERPFENIISVIVKYPWHQAHLISTMHRDHIYEMLKLSIESLKTHLAKDYVQIDPTLLERVVRAGLMCPAFTDRQKMMLLQTARIECPVDLVHYLLPTHDLVVRPPTPDYYYYCYSTAAAAAFLDQPPRQQQQQQQLLQTSSSSSSFKQSSTGFFSYFELPPTPTTAAAKTDSSSSPDKELVSI